MNNTLTWQQNIRVEALNAAVNRFRNITARDDTILQAAKQFEAYILGSEDPNKELIYIIDSETEVWVDNYTPADFTGMTISVGDKSNPHEHLPVQHRDRKEKWCNACGLNRHGLKPSTNRTQE